jgi:hypothetical protein
MAQLQTTEINGRLYISDMIFANGGIKVNNTLIDNTGIISPLGKFTKIIVDSSLEVNKGIIDSKNGTLGYELRINPTGGDLILGKDMIFITPVKTTIKDAEFTGMPIAPTASIGTNTNQVASTAFVKAEINSVLAANDAMQYKGGIAAGATLPAANCGDTYKVTSSGIIGGYKVETGDMLICVQDNTLSDTPANWNPIQTNLDGAVIGPASSTDGAVAVFDGNSGRLLKDSTYKIDSTETTNTIARRDGNGDLRARCFISTYEDQSTISGAIAFRTNANGVMRFCNDLSAIQTYLNVLDKAIAVTLEGEQTLKNKSLFEPKINSIMNTDLVGFYGNAADNGAQGILVSKLGVSNDYSIVTRNKIPNLGIYSQGDVRIGDCTLAYDPTLKALKFKFV